MPGMRNRIRLRPVEFPVHRPSPRSVPSEPRFGVVSPADVHPAVTVRSRTEVLAGFHAQELRLLIEGQPISIIASEASDGLFPFRHPVLLASTSVRKYVPWPTEVRDLDFLRATAAAGDRQWIDRMLLLRDDPQAREVAREFGGRFALRWSESGMAVIDLATDEVETTFQVRGERLTHRPCPMIPGAVAGDHCKMYGGPWVARSMVASGYWMDRRYLYEQELGCDEECPRPSVRHQDGLPTRYFTWMWQSEIDQQWEELVEFVRSH